MIPAMAIIAIIVLAIGASPWLILWAFLAIALASSFVAIDLARLLTKSGLTRRDGKLVPK